MGKIKTPGAIRGTQDIFGEDQERFGHVVDTFDRVRRLYNFRRVEMPVFEATAVFARSLGETTDVVSKEMYSFDDRSGDSLTLRPEFTAGLARAYLTNGWQQYAPLKLATHGPLFRYERPQKGRYRQFHQIDAEIIGAAEPQADVELLVMADQILRELGITQGVTLQLNTLGDVESRNRWRTANVEFFTSHSSSLSNESQIRLDKNVFRILDSKDPVDQEIVKSAPTINVHMTDYAARFYDDVKSGLKAAGVRFTENPHLVRGLDYYRHTAFEFVTDRLGAQGTVLGGGRYDGLIENLGGPATPAVGWAAGIERLAMLCEPHDEPLELFLIPASADLMSVANVILASLRSVQVSSELAYSFSNPNKRYDKCKKSNVSRVLMIEHSDRAGAVALARVRDIDENAKPVRSKLAEALSKTWRIEQEEGAGRFHLFSR